MLHYMSMMKKVLLMLGILLLFFIVLGVYSGNVFNGVVGMLWLPVSLLWDMPVVSLPLTLALMSILSLYGMVTKNYQKFYSWYRNLFVIIVFGLLAYVIEYLFRDTAYFKLNEYRILFTCFYLLLALIGYVTFVETKKDARYYIVGYGIVIIYLIGRFVWFVQ